MILIEQTFKEKLMPLINKLPDKQKMIIELIYIKKFKIDEICSLINRNKNYVKTTHKRAIKSIKKLVSENINVP